MKQATNMNTSYKNYPFIPKIFKISLSQNAVKDITVFNSKISCDGNETVVESS